MAQLLAPGRDHLLCQSPMPLISDVRPPSEWPNSCLSGHTWQDGACNAEPDATRAWDRLGAGTT
eukprot:496995-Alexandrium_andersonii.AAC.1